MNQTHATYEVNDGVLMADQNQCVSIRGARVIIQPLSQEPIVPRVQITVQERQKSRWERMADAACRVGVTLFALYFIGEVAYAFWSGAIAKVVR